jgi:hypothetical protein
MISMSYGLEACPCPANVQKLNGGLHMEDEAELSVSTLKAAEPISGYQDEGAF